MACVVSSGGTMQGPAEGEAFGTHKTSAQISEHKWGKLAAGKQSNHHHLISGRPNPCSGWGSWGATGGAPSSHRRSRGRGCHCRGGPARCRSTWNGKGAKGKGGERKGKGAAISPVKRTTPCWKVAGQECLRGPPLLPMMNNKNPPADGERRWVVVEVGQCSPPSRTPQPAGDEPEKEGNRPRANNKRGGGHTLVQEGDLHGGHEQLPVGERDELGGNGRPQAPGGTPRC